MTLQEIIKLAREVYLDDTVPSWETDDSDCLWSNSELITLANQGEREICERYPIRDDSTAGVVQIALTAGNSKYALNDAIMLVSGGTISGRPIYKTDKPFMDSQRDDWRADEGQVDALLTHDDALHVYRTPIVDETLILDVLRYPLNTLESLDDDLEVSAKWHNLIAHWIAYSAFLKPDADTTNPKLAAHHYDLFQAEAGPRLDLTRQYFRAWGEGRRARTRSYY